MFLDFFSTIENEGSETINDAPRGCCLLNVMPNGTQKGSKRERENPRRTWAERNYELRPSISHNVEIENVVLIIAFGHGVDEAELMCIQGYYDLTKRGNKTAICFESSVSTRNETIFGRMHS